MCTHARCCSSWHAKVDSSWHAGHALHSKPWLSKRLGRKGDGEGLLRHCEVHPLLRLLLLLLLNGGLLLLLHRGLLLP